jgi:2',3'-cyclic-nucleotide 2'-phosphodiesterase (5'-nucleotidase family)
VALPKAAQTQAAPVLSRSEIAGMNASLEERFGKDDKSSFVVQFTGDMHGSLDACGCKGPIYGGLARRVTYVKMFKERFKDLPSLLVDTGSMFAPDRGAHGYLRSDAEERNHWLVRAYDTYPVDVANLAPADLYFLETLVTKKQLASLSQTQPVLKRFVSANITPTTPNGFKAAPYLVREIPLPSEAGKTVRVAFVGLSETSEHVAYGMKIEDPIAAARRVIPEAKRKADVVIVLAYLKSPEAVRLANEVPGIDAIITGTGEMFTPAFRVANTLVVFTSFETRFLGELRFFRDEQGKFSIRERFISLDEVLVYDPDAQKVVEGSRDAKNKAYTQAQSDLVQWMGGIKMRPTWTRATAKPKEGAPAEYISANACAECHMDQFIKWSNSKHARATDSLMLHKDEFTIGCVECHGSGKVDKELPKLTAVSCEECHGPGSNHALKPAKGYGKVNDIKSSCSSCHTDRVSPNFDPQAAWAKIKH